MKYFHVCCDGSFGNRYSGLIGGLTLGRLCNLPIKISWPSTYGCEILFQEIFDAYNLPDGQFEVMDLNLKDFYSLSDQYNFISVNDQHMNFFGKSAVDPGGLNLESFKNVVNKSDLSIFYYTPLLYDWIPSEEINLTLRSLKFRDDILDKVYKFRKQNELMDEYYGIHIRMTDFVNIESFDVDYWVNFVLNNQDKKFFVCSDDPDTESRFNHLNNAFSYPKKHLTEKLIPDGDWHHPFVDDNGRHLVFNVKRGNEHVKEALVDFLLLSFSSPCDTGKQSTFLKMAKRLSNALKE